MNRHLSNLAFTLCLLFFGCKDNLPSSVDLGETEVHLNGCEEKYPPYFRYFKVYNLMEMTFAYRKDHEFRTLGFNWLPLESGNYGLHTDTIPHKDAAFTGFGHIVESDLEGYTYKLLNPSEGYCHIESLDTLKRIVKGRFRAEFKRTSKNGWKDFGLPETLLFEGVFHERYTVF